MFAAYIKNKPPMKVTNLWPQIRARLEREKEQRRQEEARDRLSSELGRLSENDAIKKLVREYKQLGIISEKERKRTAIAKRMLAREKQERTGKATFRRIEARICKLTNLSVPQLLSPRRDKPAVRARMCIIYWTVRLTSLTLPQIGGLMQRDHSTIISSARKWPLIREALHGRHLRRVK